MIEARRRKLQLIAHFPEELLRQAVECTWAIGDSSAVFDVTGTDASAASVDQNWKLQTYRLTEFVFGRAGQIVAPLEQHVYGDADKGVLSDSLPSGLFSAVEASGFFRESRVLVGAQPSFFPLI